MNNTSNGPPEIGLHNNFETDVTDSLYIGNSIFMNALNHSGSGTNALLVRSREHSVNPTFVIENCLIAANVSTCSNAVCSIFTNGKTAISNCTFANNSTNSNNDYTLGIKGHPVTISNSIFYSNDTPCQIKCYGLGATTLNLHNNIIQGGQRQINPGGNIVNYNDSNLNINPDFLGGDQSLPEYYYLSYQSPAINAGTSNLPFSLSEFDLANEPRVYQGIVDIGCYEWQGTTNITDINKLPNTQLTAFNTPNPFNPSTKICFNSPYNGKVKVDIYNVKGQKVKTLANKHFDAGVHKLYWNGKNANNQTTGSGVYFYKIKTQNKTIVNKMLMLK